MPLGLAAMARMRNSIGDDRVDGMMPSDVLRQAEHRVASECTAVNLQHWGPNTRTLIGRPFWIYIYMRLYIVNVCRRKDRTQLPAVGARCSEMPFVAT